MSLAERIVTHFQRITTSTSLYTYPIGYCHRDMEDGTRSYYCFRCDPEYIEYPVDIIELSAPSSEYEGLRCCVCQKLLNKQQSDQCEMVDVTVYSAHGHLHYQYSALTYKHAASVKALLAHSIINDLSTMHLLLNEGQPDQNQYYAEQDLPEEYYSSYLSFQGALTIHKELAAFFGETDYTFLLQQEIDYDL